MTEQAPPDYYFQNIIFNPKYYDNEVNNNITQYEANNTYLKKPINQNTGLLNSVLTLTNTTTKETSWTTPAVAITNYVNFDSGTSNLISNVSGTPTTITTINTSGLITGGSIRSNTSMNSATINTTGLITGNTITSTGLLTAGSISSTGLISTTGTINSAIINTTGLITAGSIKSNTAMNSATINTTGLITGNTITSTGLLTAGSISSTGLISTTGTINGAIINTSGLITGNTITSTGLLTAGSISSTGLISTTGAMNSATINTTGLITGNTITSTGLLTAGSISTGTINTNNNNINIGSGSLSASSGYVNCAVVNCSTGLNYTGGQISAYGAFMYLDGLYASGTSTGIQCERLNCGGLNNCKVQGLICQSGGDIVVKSTLNGPITASILSNGLISTIGAMNSATINTTGLITGDSIKSNTSMNSATINTTGLITGATITSSGLLTAGSIGSSTAQKFSLPSNTSTSTAGQVLSILDATAKTTQWLTIPTQISTYVDYNIFTGVLIYKSLSPASNITSITIDDIGKSGQTFTLPNNTSTAPLNSVLTLSNISTKQTTWTTIPNIINYVNYSNPNLISNVSGTPSTISNLTISGNIKSDSYDSSVADTGIITIGGGTSRTGDINIGTGKNTSSAQLIRIGSNDNNATGQEIRFSRPIQPPAIIQLSDRDMGYTLSNLTATTAAYASGSTVSLSIPSTNLYSNGNYMFRSSLKMNSNNTAKTLTSIKFGLNRSNTPIGYIENCYTDMAINTGTAVIFINKVYQLSSFFRTVGGASYTFDYVITFTGTGTLNVVSSIDIIRIS